MSYKRRRLAPRRSSRRVSRRTRRPMNKFKRTVTRIAKRCCSGETKYIAREISNLVVPNSSDTFDDNLQSTEYKHISIFPNTGVLQNQRIGNSIEKVKMWVRIKILLTPSSQFIPCCEIRIIVFTINWHGVTPATGSIQDFWKFDSDNCPNPMMNDVNRDIVTVKYDRVHKMRSLSNGDYTGTYVANKEYDVKNISLNFKLGSCKFNGTGDIYPKQSSKVYYVASIGKTSSASGNLAIVQVFNKVYYQDN